MSSNGPFYAEGWYVANVDDHAWQTSKNGHPMLVVKLTPEATLTTTFNAAGEPTEHTTPVSKMYQRTTRIVINETSDESMDFALMKLRYAGFEGDSFRELDLRNVRVRAVCKHEEGEGQWAGKTFERWELPLPPRENEPLEEDSTVVRKLDALFGRKLKRGAERPQPAPVKAADQASEPIDDSDIPF